MFSRAALFTGFLLAVWPLHAAINPEEFLRQATDVVRVREIGRVVATDDEKAPRQQRVTLLVEVLAVERTRDQALRPGAHVLIDYTVDLRERERRERAHRRDFGDMPGPQFMYEPSAPEPRESQEFTAFLTPAHQDHSRRGYAGHTPHPAGAVRGPVFVPAAGQYSFRLH